MTPTQEQKASPTWEWVKVNRYVPSDSYLHLQAFGAVPGVFSTSRSFEQRHAVQLDTTLQVHGMRRQLHPAGRLPQRPPAAAQ